MQCAEFDQRVNALLDARLGTEKAALWQHARRCPGCAELLEGYRALEHVLDRLPTHRSQRPLDEQTIDAVVGQRPAVWRLMRAAAVAAGITIAVGLPINLARRPPAAPPTSGAQAIASSPVASPPDAIRAAGESWWALMRESAQPLATAPKLLPRPDFDGIAEALKYAPSRLGVLSWAEIGMPFGETTSEAMEFFHNLPTLPRTTTSSPGSSS